MWDVFNRAQSDLSFCQTLERGKNSGNTRIHSSQKCLTEMKDKSVKSLCYLHKGRYFWPVFYCNSKRDTMFHLCLSLSLSLSFVKISTHVFIIYLPFYYLALQQDVRVAWVRLQRWRDDDTNRISTKLTSQEEFFWHGNSKSSSSHLWDMDWRFLHKLLLNYLKLYGINEVFINFINSWQQLLCFTFLCTTTDHSLLCLQWCCWFFLP